MSTDKKKAHCLEFAPKEFCTVGEMRAQVGEMRARPQVGAEAQVTRGCRMLATVEAQQGRRVRSVTPSPHFYDFEKACNKKFPKLQYTNTQ